MNKTTAVTEIEGYNDFFSKRALHDDSVENAAIRKVQNSSGTKDALFTKCTVHSSNRNQQAAVGVQPAQLQEHPVENIGKMADVAEQQQQAENNNIDEDRRSIQLQQNSVAQGSINEGESNTDANDKIEDMEQKIIENEADKLSEKAYDDVFGGNANTKEKK